MRGLTDFRSGATIDLNLALQGGAFSGGDASGFDVALHAPSNNDVGGGDVGLHLRRFSDNDRPREVDSAAKGAHELDIAFAGQLPVNLDLLSYHKRDDRDLNYRRLPGRLRTG